jgi:hypothetical protein
MIGLTDMELKDLELLIEKQVEESKIIEYKEMLDLNKPADKIKLL